MEDKILVGLTNENRMYILGCGIGAIAGATITFIFPIQGMLSSLCFLIAAWFFTILK
jgi:hypothetical protein